LGVFGVLGVFGGGGTARSNGYANYARVEVTSSKRTK